MQISNIDLSRNNQSFTAISLGSGAKSVLQKALKPADWLEFDKLIKAQKENPVDIKLYGRESEGKLEAKIISNNRYMSLEKIYFQLPFFESTIKFITKLCNKADKMEAKIKQMPEVDVDAILQGMTSTNTTAIQKVGNNLPAKI